MSNVVWAIQEKMLRSDNVDAIKLACDDLKIKNLTVNLIPFDDSFLDIPNDNPTVFYGSTSLRLKALKEFERYTPGIFFEEDSFSFQALVAGYGRDNLLNGNSSLISVEQFLKDNDAKSDELIFMRPALDSKTICGRVETRRWYDEHIKVCLNQRHGPDNSTLLQLSEPQTIDWEYRLFIVDKKVIASSSYKIRGHLNINAGVPEYIIHYGEEMANHYSPSPVFVMDVCELPNKQLKIVENNCFNCSGLYHADPKAIVETVTNYIENNYRL